MMQKQLSRAGQAVAALRYPQYRKYWLATLASVIGFQMLMFTQLWLVRQLEEDPLWLGAVGFATAVPAILLTMFGGVVADRLDQRRLIVLTQALAGGLVFLLATLTLTGVVEVWHVLVLAFCNGAIQAFDGPARQALFPHLIERREMTNAVALNASIWQSSRMVAPMTAGLLIATFGTAVTLYVAAAGFLVMIATVSTLRAPPIQRSTGSHTQQMLEGARFVRSDSLFASLIGMTFFTSFFGLVHIQLMPIFTVDVLHRGAEAQGFLVGVGGMGALLGTITAASLGRFPHRGWMIIATSLLFSGVVITFGLSRWYPLSLGALFLGGFFQSVYMITIMSTLQMRVPDRLRGRVMGIYGMTYNLMPLGGMLGGAVASAASAPAAVVLGGSMVAGFAIFNAAFNPTVRRLRPERALADGHSGGVPGPRS